MQQLLAFFNEVNYRATTRYSLLTCIKQLDRGRGYIRQKTCLEGSREVKVAAGRFRERRGGFGNSVEV